MLGNLICGQNKGGYTNEHNYVSLLHLSHRNQL